jgi:antitoxin FitA
MSSITIRNLEPAIKDRLRIRAAENGHSMEAEARRILHTALIASPRPPATDLPIPNLYERIRALVEPVGGIDVEVPSRDPVREVPTFD